MIITSMFARRVVLVALILSMVGLVGCNSDSGGSAALPPSDGSAAPPPPPKEALDSNGWPKDSTAAFDTARGAKPPR